MVVLNTNCTEIGGCEPGSPHYEWLAADLAANPASCTLVYGHHPYYTVGPHDRSTELRPFWELAYDRGVDLWLVGHDHNYQRLLPRTPTAPSIRNGASPRFWSVRVEWFTPPPSGWARHPT